MLGLLCSVCALATTSICNRWICSHLPVTSSSTSGQVLLRQGIQYQRCTCATPFRPGFCGACRSRSTWNNDDDRNLPTTSAHSNRRHPCAIHSRDMLLDADCDLDPQQQQQRQQQHPYLLAPAALHHHCRQSAHPHCVAAAPASSLTHCCRHRQRRLLLQHPNTPQPQCAGGALLGWPQRATRSFCCLAVGKAAAAAVGNSLTLACAALLVS